MHLELDYKELAWQPSLELKYELNVDVATIEYIFNQIRAPICK